MNRRLNTATVVALAALALACPTGSPRAQTAEAALPPADPMDTPAAEAPPSIAVDFAPGSAWLSDQAITGLDLFTYYNVLKGPVQRVRIVVHADEPGLAARRAEAVAAFVESKGVARADMSVEDAASDLPTVADDGDAEPRIEIFTR